jgi:hypothetical protein
VVPRLRRAGWEHFEIRTQIRVRDASARAWGRTTRGDYQQAKTAHDRSLQASAENVTSNLVSNFREETETTEFMDAAGKRTLTGYHPDNGVCNAKKYPAFP